jgi:thiol-disulfide isomerase/thioredoxin/sugar lactone lactonase YvrE
VSAPELIGDTWWGTGGRKLSLADFRGRFLLLDFWTLCCVNCHHVLAELRPIEAEFADTLTVVGIHSPKFEFEKDPASVKSAVQRHGIDHPVLNDPDMATWRSYDVRAWPTLILIDPRGDIVGTWSGEGHGHAIAATLNKLIPQYEESLQRGEGLFRAEDSPTSTYLQPGKIETLSSEHVLISDSGHHSLVIALTTSPNQPIQRIGSGDRGFLDGSFESAQFNEPYGAVVLPADIADKVGYHVVVADTVNHALRGLNLDEGTVTTIAGTGEQWRPGNSTSGNAMDTRLTTPWDVAWVNNLVYIAMAGDHRIWTFDPITHMVTVAAGTTHEGLVDGPVSDAWFAQPSALATTQDSLWIADSETSALRRIHNDTVITSIGTGLFDFGHVDGNVDTARLQHPLGLAVHTDGSIFIADTYNGSIRRFDPHTLTVSTITRDLAEPSDLSFTADGLSILVVESASGNVTTIPIGQSTTVTGQAMRTVRPELDITAGSVTIHVTFTPPPGEKIDDRYGPSTQLSVSASPAHLILSGEGTGSDLVRTVTINPEVESGVLHVAAKGASCDADSEHGACHMHQQDWGVPVRITPTGTTTVQLTLAN